MKLSCRAPIAVAGVFVQDGDEIEGFDDLDPDAGYPVYLPATTLMRLAEVDAVPLLDDTHVAIATADFDPASVIGLAHNIAYGQSRLWANLVFWHPASIAGIKSGTGPRQLSIGFRPTYSQAPGEFQGKSYDFIMTDAVLDHVALVTEGEMGNGASLPLYRASHGG